MDFNMGFFFVLFSFFCVMIVCSAHTEDDFNLEVLLSQSS